MFRQPANGSAHLAPKYRSRLHVRAASLRVTSRDRRYGWLATRSVARWLTDSAHRPDRDACRSAPRRNRRGGRDWVACSMPSLSPAIFFCRCAAFALPSGRTLNAQRSLQCIFHKARVELPTTRTHMLVRPDQIERAGFAVVTSGCKTVDVVHYLRTRGRSELRIVARHHNDELQRNRPTLQC